MRLNTRRDWWRRRATRDLREADMEERSTAVKGGAEEGEWRVGRARQQCSNQGNKRGELHHALLVCLHNAYLFSAIAILFCDGVFLLKSGSAHLIVHIQHLIMNLINNRKGEERRGKESIARARETRETSKRVCA